MPSEHWVSRAVRSTGLRSRCPNTLRNTHSRRDRCLFEPPGPDLFPGRSRLRTHATNNTVKKTASRTEEEGFISMLRWFPLPCFCNLRPRASFSKT